MSGLRSTGRTKSSVLGSCLPAWRLPPWSLLQTSSAEAKRLVASRRFGEKQGIDATQAKPHGCCKDTVINWSKASNFRSRGRQVWGDRPGDCLMVGDGDLRCPSCSAFLEELQYITQMRCPGSTSTRSSSVQKLPPRATRNALFFHLPSFHFIASPYCTSSSTLRLSDSGYARRPTDSSYYARRASLLSSTSRFVRRTSKLNANRPVAKVTGRPAVVEVRFAVNRVSSSPSSSRLCLAVQVWLEDIGRGCFP